MVSFYDIASAAGRAGLGSEAAAGASSGAWGLAARVRQWSAQLAGEVEHEAHSVQDAAAEATRVGQVHWESHAGRAFSVALEAEHYAGQHLGQELTEAAAQVRVAGEMLAAELEIAAAAIGAAGAALDAALAGLGAVEGVMDDFLGHAEQAGLPALRGALDSAVSNPLLARVSDALVSLGR
ncbi:hypothetical protein [Rothia nasimurium]|uniref:hypothetical protein n=1 Tax=Rothia nasimurium TaxID=85336 RepID=UPI003BA0C030